MRKKIKRKNLPTVFFSQSDKADIRELIESEATKEEKTFVL